MFDKNGNMRQWWSNKTVAEYINRTTCFINQYSSYYLSEVEDYVSVTFIHLFVNVNILFNLTLFISLD